MSLFRKSAEYDLDACQTALRENADAIAQAEKEIAEHSLAGVTTGDDRASSAAQRLLSLQASRRVLEQARSQAEQKQRETDAAEGRRLLEARARSAEQHAGASRREVAAIEQAAADLVQHYRAAQAALGRLRAVVGDDPETSPGLSLADLRRQVLDELWRASVEPSIAGDRSPFVASPSIQIAANQMPPLSVTIDRDTRHATGLFRARMGLDRAHVHAEAETP